MSLVELPWLSPKFFTVVVDGEVYDLQNFIDRHPGGPSFIFFSKNRDISLTVNTYHMRMDKVAATLKKYHIGPADPHQLPEQYVNQQYMSSTPPKEVEHPPIPAFDFNMKNQFQKQVIETINNDPKFKANLKLQDWYFEMSTYAGCVLYLVFAYAFATARWNPWFCVFWLICIRMSLGAFGHFGAHSYWPDWWPSMSDATYYLPSAGMKFFHSMEHHAIGDMGIEPHRMECQTALLVPRLWRFLVVCFGHQYQFFYKSPLLVLSRAPGLFVPVVRKSLGTLFLCCMLVRFIMLLECIGCVMNGLWFPWLVQALGTRFTFWLMVIGSHDLMGENELANEDLDCKDWGLFQVRHATNYWITGNDIIDCLLSAGHSCHTVHHLLPFQRSGYTHIATLPLVKKLFIARGEKWNEHVSFFGYIIPNFLRFMFIARAPRDKSLSFVQENFSKHTVDAIITYLNDLI